MPKVMLPNGIEQWYEVTQGPAGAETVLLLMGTGSDHSMWATQVEAYTRDFRLVTIDSRGTGQSTRPKDPSVSTPFTMAEDAKLLLDQLGIDRVHLGGLSLGSAIAQEFAIAWPERLHSLALHCTWGRSDEWFIRMIDTMEYPAKLGDAAMFLRVGLMWVLSPTFLETRKDEVAAIERAVLEQNPFPPTGEGICNHTHADKSHDTMDRLHRITARTLVTAGEADCIVPPRYGEEVARHIPGAQYLLFRGPASSHVACIEMKDEWNARTLAFLKGETVGVRLA